MQIAFSELRERLARGVFRRVAHDEEPEPRGPLAPGPRVARGDRLGRRREPEQVRGAQEVDRVQDEVRAQERDAVRPAIDRTRRRSRGAPSRDRAAGGSADRPPPHAPARSPPRARLPSPSSPARAGRGRPTRRAGARRRRARGPVSPARGVERHRLAAPVAREQAVAVVRRREPVQLEQDRILLVPRESVRPFGGGLARPCTRRPRGARACRRGTAHRRRPCTRRCRPARRPAATRDATRRPRARAARSRRPRTPGSGS